MVFGSGLRSTISSGSYVSHHNCHLSNSSYALLLPENTWQLGMNSNQSSSSSSSSPCPPPPPLIVGDDDGHVVLRCPPGPLWLDFGSFHNHRRDRSGAIDDPPRLVAVLVGPISALHELISCHLVRVGFALLLGLGSRTGWGGTARTSLFLWLVWDSERLLRCWL